MSRQFKVKPGVNSDLARTQEVGTAISSELYHKSNDLCGAKYLLKFQRGKSCTKLWFYDYQLEEIINNKERQSPCQEQEKLLQPFLGW